MTWTQHFCAVLSKEGADYEALKKLTDELDKWATEQARKKNQLWAR